PMGNFSINHYSGLEVGREEIRIRYILDFAEIPTFQEMQVLDTDRNGDITPAERDHYLSGKATALAGGLRVQVNEILLALRAESSELTVIPGASGLPTIKVSILYHATVGDHAMSVGGRTAGQERVLGVKSWSWPARGWEGENDRSGWADADADELFYRDENYLGRAGWKEMAAVGLPGTRIVGSTLPAIGTELRAYSDNDIQSPPQIIETRFSFGPHAGADENAVNAGLQSIPKRTSRWSEGLTSLITVNTPGSPMILLSLLVAFGLGTIHALSPGHGKTVVAAYLVGSRGTARHALLLGATVTVSHTIGVFLLGLATLYLSKFFVPEHLYPWLGFFSGLSIFMIGLILLRQRWQSTWNGMPSHDVDHPDGDHEHLHDHGHHHHHHGHRHRDGSLRGIVGLGITGGIVPCPSALVVLLSAIAFHQIAFGLLLIVAFSAGIAATLVGIGLVVVYIGEVMNRVDRFQSVTRLLPVVSAAGVALLGGAIALGTWF
ncbi:MAG TPA: sulfite exporter TauE/SafE family protein, partial [Nitrospiraceae bacterium]|nr:sulfite exporter TauE/SafE family protein [Nitrospiraceae bacterium]